MSRWKGCIGAVGVLESDKADRGSGESRVKVKKMETKDGKKEMGV